MKLNKTLTAACLFIASAIVSEVAQAQPVTGPYVSLGGGVTILNPYNYVETGYNRLFPSVGAGGTFLFRPGGALEADIGYGFGNGFRMEIEGNYFHNTIHKDDAHTRGWTGQFLATGAQYTYGVMVNGIYDLPVGWLVHPYVGAGVGYEITRIAPNFYDVFNSYSSGAAGSFAYQIITGVSYPLPFVHGLSLTAKYCFEQMVESRTYWNPEGAFFVGPERLGNMSSHTFLLGLRYQLFTPPATPAAVPVPAPAPVAAPAPAPARTYLVFFDWDTANLTTRTRQIVSEAAQASQTTKVTRLDVNGYTDTSGPAGYNMSLSLRRANNVAAALVADGVPKGDIVIKGFGETHLLVPTGPNVREPQNRRVEIILH